MHKVKSIITCIFGLVASGCCRPQSSNRTCTPDRVCDPPIWTGRPSPAWMVIDSRTCDYPEVLSTSGSLAQCCRTGVECVFWSFCSAATLFAQSTSLFCDQGLCNTGVLIPTAGASEGVSYLGC
ncbi:hypothetical protein PTNB73_01488 [Pyrenophora teres f. teres]|nr:hypothetical protein HRS9122_01194 [Pyrenophora teres f. teres]KAE8872337.1 hypothetical protein PTNB73_01488 [Pyrenophora teres f. teres]